MATPKQPQVAFHQTPSGLPQAPAVAQKKHISYGRREDYILEIERQLMQKYRVGYSGLHKMLVIKEGQQQFSRPFLWSRSSSDSTSRSRNWWRWFLHTRSSDRIKTPKLFIWMLLLLRSKPYPNKIYSLRILFQRILLIYNSRRWGDLYIKNFSVQKEKQIPLLNAFWYNEMVSAPPFSSAVLIYRWITGVPVSLRSRTSTRFYMQLRIGNEYADQQDPLLLLGF